MKKQPKIAYSKVLLIMGAALIASLILSVTLGRYPMDFREMSGILWNHLMDAIENAGRAIGLHVPELGIEPFWSKTQASLLLQHRMPRIWLACLVGCCLASAGAAYQGVFQNPMAAPDILGASSGAAFGAALAILLDLGGGMITIMAFVSSIVTVLLVIYVGGRAKGKRVVGLILAGIMIGSLVSSGTSFVKLVADPDDQLPAITYWLMCSLNGASPKDVWFSLIPMGLGLIPLFLLRWRINILTLGDDEARTMGVNPKRLRVIVILSATMITAASVAVSGVIGWVGLVIPHLTRRIVGNNYRKLMPATMLLGAIFMLLVDDVSRNLFVTEIPIGILTSLIGAPFFIYLITRDGEQL